MLYLINIISQKRGKFKTFITSN